MNETLTTSFKSKNKTISRLRVELEKRTELKRIPRRQLRSSAKEPEIQLKKIKLNPKQKKILLSREFTYSNLNKSMFSIQEKSHNKQFVSSKVSLNQTMQYRNKYCSEKDEKARKVKSLSRSKRLKRKRTNDIGVISNKKIKAFDKFFKTVAMEYRGIKNKQQLIPIHFNFSVPKNKRYSIWRNNVRKGTNPSTKDLKNKIQMFLIECNKQKKSMRAKHLRSEERSKSLRVCLNGKSRTLFNRLASEKPGRMANLSRSFKMKFSELDPDLRKAGGLLDKIMNRRSKQKKGEKNNSSKIQKSKEKNFFNEKDEKELELKEFDDKKIIDPGTLEESGVEDPLLKLPKINEEFFNGKKLDEIINETQNMDKIALQKKSNRSKLRKKKKDKVNLETLIRNAPFYYMDQLEIKFQQKKSQFQARLYQEQFNDNFKEVNSYKNFEIEGVEVEYKVFVDKPQGKFCC